MEIDQAAHSGDIGRLIDGIPDPVLILDSDDRVVFANSAATEWFEIELYGLSHFALFRQPEALDCIEEAKSGNGSREVEFSTIRNDVRTAVRINATPLDCPNLGLDGLLICQRDVSKLDEVDQLRREFVANVSHELRSPLTSLFGAIEALKGVARDDDSTTRARVLDIMDAEAKRMKLLVSDLLSLSRVEASERMRPTEDVEITDVIDHAIGLAAPLSREVGTRILVDCPGPNLVVSGDRGQLVQAMLNLIENSLKYAEGGSEIFLGCRSLESLTGFDGPVVEIELRDRGQGIEARHIPRLTERFYRVDRNRTGEGGGTGLGLAIVKHIVNRHRGRMSISSTTGVGTTVRVLLPAAGDRERQT